MYVDDIVQRKSAADVEKFKNSSILISVMSRNLKFLEMCRNSRFLHICHVKKSDIPPHDRFFLHE